MSLKKYLSATTAALVISTLTATNIFATKAEVIATGENKSDVTVFSDNGKDLGSIQKGSWFNIYEVKDGFAKISGIHYQGIFSTIEEGWVDLNNIDAIFIEKEEPIATGENNIKLDILDDNRNKIGEMEKGSWFNIYEEKDNKFRIKQIQLNGVENSVREGWIDQTDVTTIYLEKEKAISTGETLEDTIVYNEQGYEIGTIKAGTCFNIYEINEGVPYDLYKIKQIQSSNIREGWVRNTNIKVTTLDGNIIMPEKGPVENKDIEIESGNGLESDPLIVKINTVNGLKPLGKNVVKIKQTKEIDNFFVYYLKLTEGDTTFFVNAKVEKTNSDVIEQLEKIEEDFAIIKPVQPNKDIEVLGGNGSVDSPLVFKVNTLNGLNSIINENFDVVRLEEAKEEDSLYHYSLKLTIKDTDEVLYVNIKTDNTDVINKLESIEVETKGEVPSTPIIPNTEIEVLGGDGSEFDPLTFTVYTQNALNSLLKDEFDIVRIGKGEPIEDNKFYTYSLKLTNEDEELYMNINVYKNNSELINELNKIKSEYVSSEIITPNTNVESLGGNGTKYDPLAFKVNNINGLKSLINNFDVVRVEAGKPMEADDYYIYSLKLTNSNNELYMDINVEKHNVIVINELNKIKSEYQMSTPITPSTDLEVLGGDGSEYDPLSFKVNNYAGLKTLLKDNFEANRLPDVLEEDGLFVYTLKLTDKTSKEDIYMLVRVDKTNAHLVSELDRINQILPPVVEEGGSGDVDDPYTVIVNSIEGLETILDENSTYYRVGEIRQEGDFFVCTLKVFPNVSKNTFYYMDVKVSRNNISIVAKLNEIPKEEVKEEDDKEDIIVNDIIDLGGIGSSSNPFTLKANTLDGLNRILAEIESASIGYTRLNDPQVFEENYLLYRLHYIEPNRLGLYVNIIVEKDNTELTDVLNKINKIDNEEDIVPPIINNGGSGEIDNPYNLFIEKEEGLDILFTQIKDNNFTYKTVGNYIESEILDLKYYTYLLLLEKDNEKVFVQIRVNASNTTMVERLNSIENIDEIIDESEIVIKDISNEGYKAIIVERNCVYNGPIKSSGLISDTTGLEFGHTVKVLGYAERTGFVKVSSMDGSNVGFVHTDNLGPILEEVFPEEDEEEYR